MNELLIRILYVYITSFACHQGRSYRGCGGTGVPYCPQCLDCRHICRILIALVIFVLLIKLKESPLCLQIGLQRSLFVGKSWLCNLSIIFFSFAPACHSNGTQSNQMYFTIISRIPFPILLHQHSYTTLT